MRVTEKIANDILQQFKDKTPKEISSIIAACDRLTPSNCWWVEYRLKDLIREIAENELALREKNEKDS